MGVTLNKEDLSLLPKKYSDLFEVTDSWNDLGVMNGVGSFKSSASKFLNYLYAPLNPESSILENALLNSQKTLNVGKEQGLKLGYGWIKFLRYS